MYVCMYIYIYIYIYIYSERSRSFRKPSEPAKYCGLVFPALKYATREPANCCAVSFQH